MKFGKMTALIVFFTLIAAGPAWPHFGMLIPSDPMVMRGCNRTITIRQSFSHPFEGMGMELAKSKVFSVLAGGKKGDMRGSLEATRVMGHTAWQAAYPLNRPGVHMFYMEPEPHWERLSGCTFMA